MYYKARELALNNEHLYHLTAILKRKGSIIRMASNSNKTNPIAKRVFSNGDVLYTMHAEMNVLRYAMPGDELVVLRWHKNGEPAMAKPCCYCSKLIVEKGIKKVTYTNENGEMESYKP